MTDARFGGLARETLDAQTGTVRLAGVVREALVFVDTDALFTSVTREVLLAGRTASFAGLVRETLDAQTGRVSLAGLARETLLSGTTGAGFAGLVRETLLAGTTVSFGSVLREALLSTTTVPVTTHPQTLFIANIGRLMGRHS